MKTKRKTISKSVRFEVFKRDSFKCQYCGRSAPEVILHVDHIDPVSKGGNQVDIVNLLTACLDCNLGKGARVLSDESAVTKRKAQIDELQQRREQLEMMSQWQRGLIDLTEIGVAQCGKIFSQVMPGFQISEIGRSGIRKLVVQFGVADVMQAIHKSARYLVPNGATGESTVESVSVAFSKIGGICVLERRAKDDPELHDVYKIKAMVCRIVSDIQPWEVLADIKLLRGKGIPVADIRSRLEGIRGWRDYKDAIGCMSMGNL